MCSAAPAQYLFIKRRHMSKSNQAQDEFFLETNPKETVRLIQEQRRRFSLNMTEVDDHDQQFYKMLYNLELVAEDLLRKGGSRNV